MTLSSFILILKFYEKKIGASIKEKLKSVGLNFLRDPDFTKAITEVSPAALKGKSSARLDILAEHKTEVDEV